MTSGINNFYTLEKSEYHQKRKQAITQKYGRQVLDLQGQNRWSALWVAILVCASFFLANVLKDASWWQIIPTAFLCGAFIHHALYVQIHECTHNLIFKNRWQNKVMGLICDLPLVFPSAMAFRKYHMYHHRHLGHHELDPDVPPAWEASLVGTNSLRKFLWICFYFISQAMRPGKLKNVQLFNPWIIGNLILIILIDILIFILVGPKALIYLFLSTFFALGPHPLGGRWIQEHFVTKENQETYSYYGPLNKLTFNMGHHNEHHDFMNIPWNNLPKLTKLAPDYYNNLASYNSWSWVIWNFVMSKKIGPFSRYVHQNEKVLIQD